MTRPDRAAGLTRRTALTVLGSGAVALGALTACSKRPEPEEAAPVTPERFTYGDSGSQWADLYRPEGASKGVVVVIHGGFWRAQYDASLGVPLAEDLAARGWTAWNLEYRRVGGGRGGGGGWPATFDDVSAGIDLLRDTDADLTTVVVLGHSAGGHLAAWAAARGRFPRWPVRVPVTGVVSQAGVLDLTSAFEQDLGGGAVQDFLGRPPGPGYDEIDPQRQLPLDVPVRCVYGRDDTVVPFSQSRRYVAAAQRAGADAELLEVDGDHFTLIDPAGAAWAQTVGLLEGLG